MIALLAAAVAVTGHPAVRLLPAPPRVTRACAVLHVPWTFLCPTALPRPMRGWRRATPPPTYVSIFGSPAHPHVQTPYGLEFGYSAPVEPESGPNWRRLVWHNRPCCFLHFTLFIPHGPASRMPPMRPARLGGKSGRIRYARGYGLRGSVGIYWANHTWFSWRANGVRWVASLHYFGPGTTRLLGRIVAGLRPAGR